MYRLNWEKVIPNQEVPEGLESLSASECGDCHEEIYREWQASNHAIAWQDMQFQAEWAKDDSLWVCLNCHTPLQNQQEFIILGKQDGDYFKPVKQANPHFDPKLKEESITCAVCHVRDGAVIGLHGNQTDAAHKVKKDSSLMVSIILFASGHFNWQNILCWWKRAGGIGCKSAGRIVGFIEINGGIPLFVWRRDGEKPAGPIGIFTICSISED